MARVSIYVPQVGVPVAPAQRVPDTSQVIGQVADKAFAAYDEIERRDGNIEAALKSSELRTKWLNRVREDRDNGRVGKGYTPQILSEVDGEIAAALGGAGNSYARDGLTLALADLRGDMETAALGVESEWRVERAKGSIVDTINNRISEVAQADVPWQQVRQRYDETVALIESQALDEKTKGALRAIAPGIGDAYMSVLTKVRPQEALNILMAKDHPLREAISAERAGIYINQAQAEVDQREAKARSDAQMAAYEYRGEQERRVKDTITTARVYGEWPDTGDIEKAALHMTPAAKSSYLEDLRYNYSIGSTLKKLDLYPSDVLRSRAAEIVKEGKADTGGEGAAERLASRDLQQKKIEFILDRRRKDPVQAMVDTIPDVAGAWNAYANAAPSEKAAALNYAVEKTKYGHAVFGTPGDQLPIVTNAQAEAIATQLNDAAPEDVSNTLAFYGAALKPQDWNMLFRQMKGKLTPHMQVAATINDPGRRAIAIQATRMDPKEITVERLNEVVPSIAANSSWQAHQSSLMSSGDTVGMIGPTRDVIQRFAVHQMVTLGKSPSAAVEEAVKAVITDNYHLIKPGALDVRVPVTAGVDPSRVNTTLRAIMSEIDPPSISGVPQQPGGGFADDVIVSKPGKQVTPLEFERPRAAPGTIGADIDEQQRRGLSVNGGWIVNEDETGVYLAKGPDNTIKDRSGALIMFKWKDLEQASDLGVLWNAYKGRPNRAIPAGRPALPPVPRLPPIKSNASRPPAAQPRATAPADDVPAEFRKYGPPPEADTATEAVEGAVPASELGKVSPSGTVADPAFTDPANWNAKARAKANAKAKKSAPSIGPQKTGGKF